METGRRILHVPNGRYELAVERAFESEAELHRAIAEHPEVLPSEDFELDPLIPVASELDLGAGPVDLLCVDGLGHLVIIEFKRGSGGSRVREVIAQMLDYGSALWGTSPERLEERAAECPPGFDDGLVNHVDTRVTALLPSWVAEQSTSDQADERTLSELLEEADEDVWRLHELLAAVADDVGAMVEDAARGRHYRPASGRYGISLQPQYRNVHFWLASFHDRGELEAYEGFRTVLRGIHPSGKELSPKHPGVPVTALLDNWERVEQELVRPYLEGRLRHVQDEQEQGEGPGS